MQLTESQIRSIISNLILEGYKDEQRYLQEKNPEISNEIGRLSPKYVSWLTARYGEKPSREEIEPISDAIVTIVNFAKKDDSIKAKYANPGTAERPNKFREAVDTAFPPGTRSWDSPTDVMTMTIAHMEMILGLAERKKQRFDVTQADDIEGDRVGKVGPWNLWMPTTRERSCKIAQYDPVTLAPKTTWCTARTAGSNLFYNYVGRAGADMTLFYIIKDNPSDTQDWLSVGFVNGRPSLDGASGGISVDRSNAGLTPKRLESILGSYHDEIMARLTERNRELGGQHPAHQKIKDATQRVDALKYLTGGLSSDEAADLKTRVLREPNVTPDVLAFLAGDSDQQIRQKVAQNTSSPAEALMKLADDNQSDVVAAVAQNPSTPADVLMRMTSSEDINVMSALSVNPSTPAESLMKLANASEWQVRKDVAQNTSTPAEALMKLADDSIWKVRKSAAQNTSTPVDVLMKLASDKHSDVAVGVAQNPSTPADVLGQMASSRDLSVIRALSKNTSVPSDVLVQLMDANGPHARDGVMRQNIAMNTSTPHDVLRQFAEDPWLRQILSSNSSTPPDILEQLADDTNWIVRHHVALNPSTPVNVLKKLAGDTNGSVSSKAQESLANRETEIKESMLRQLVRHLAR
jgi:pentose-5-phosphate-3-epimerase